MQLTLTPHHRRITGSQPPHVRALAIMTESYSERFGDEPPALSLVAPAKINLFLRIMGKREDGYHELASLFQAVSLMDELDFWLEEPDSSQPICSMEVSPNSVGREGVQGMRWLAFVH